MREWISKRSCEPNLKKVSNIRKYWRRKSQKSIEKEHWPILVRWKRFRSMPSWKRLSRKWSRWNLKTRLLIAKFIDIPMNMMHRNRQLENQLKELNRLLLRIHQDSSKVRFSKNKNWELRPFWGKLKRLYHKMELVHIKITDMANEINF